MITPNKVVSLKSSALGPATKILERGPHPITVADLQQSLEKEFESIDQFILALDALYVLGRINIDFSAGVLSYVD